MAKTKQQWSEPASTSTDNIAAVFGAELVRIAFKVHLMTLQFNRIAKQLLIFILIGKE